MREPIGKTLRFKILTRDKFRCRYCGRGPDDGHILEIDHVIPVAKGGTNDEANLVAACLDCNRGKSARVVPEAGTKFLLWLRAQQHRDDPVGDLADDEAKIPLFEPNSYSDLCKQLRMRGAQREVLRAAWDAWREWRRGGKRTPTTLAVDADTRASIQRSLTDEACHALKAGFWSGGRFFPNSQRDA